MDFGRMAIRVVLLTAILFWSGQVLAANAPASPPVVAQAPAHWHDMDFDAFHHPFDGLEMGLDLRLREVYARNIFSPNKSFGDDASGSWNEHNWQEYRMRWSTVWTLAPDVTFNTRLVWDFWTITSPQRHFNDALSNQNTDFREMIFDRMNIQWKNAFDAPMTLTVGRQDIILGTGWLVLDGSPADDGRTIFFDAVRATIDMSEKTQLDLIAIKQYDDEETWLTPFNHRDFINTTQKTDEDGFIAYLTDKSFDNTQLEAYYIYKKEEPSNYAKFWQYKDKNWSSAPGLDAEIHTLGGRIAQQLDSNWSYSAEAAKQFGTRNMESMKGLGTNDKLTYAFNDELKNELHVGYEYLSGDDPSTTSASEKFDTLWGDWPQMQRGSDLQSYLWTFEGALGEVANLHRVGVGHSFKPNAEWSLSTDYNLMWADQNGVPSAPAPFDTPAYSANSYFRGQMFSWLAVYSCCKNFSTHFALDYFVPGSFYDESNRDHAVYARVNVEWTF
jgi:hypothetical protein